MLSKTLRKIWKILGTLDFFQIPIALYYKRRKQSSSNLGTLLSLALYSILIYNFTQSDFIKKNSPYVMSQAETHVHASSILFSPERLMSVSLGDDDAVNYIDPTIFNISYQLQHFKTNEKGIFQPVLIDERELHICSSQDVNGNPGMIQELGLANSYCLERKDFKLEGFWDESEIFFVNVELFPCNNLTMNDTCKSAAEINEFFSAKRMFFQAYFHNVGVKLDDYENPIKEKIENVYQLVDTSLFKKLEVFMKNIDVLTDDGWFFTDTRIQGDVMVDRTNIDITVRDPTKMTGSLSQIVFFASHEYQKHTRRYQNLSETLASLFGMGNFLLFFCFMFTNMVNELQIMVNILNVLYDFERLRTSKMRVKNVNVEHKVNRLTTTGLGQIKRPQSVLENLHAKTKGLIKFLNISRMWPQPKYRLSISVLEYMRYILKLFSGSKKTQKERLIKKSMEIYEQEMDVRKILAKIQEIEKLKLVLLNEDQQMLFESIKKPVVKIEEGEDTQEFEKIDSAKTMEKTFFRNSKWNFKEKNLTQSKSFQKSYEKVQKGMDNFTNRKLIELTEKTAEKVNQVELNIDLTH